MKSFYDEVHEICDKDTRYKFDAYEFVMEALHYTQNKFKRSGHITGRELLEGVRQLGMDQFGAFARTVFEHWGVHKTDDFGEIVYNMVNNGLLNKTEKDSIEDFRSVYSFEDVFKEDLDVDI